MGDEDYSGYSYELENTSVYTNRTQCFYNDRTQYILYAVTITAAVTILLVLSFTRPRVRLCRKFLWGLPGLIVPVNLLSSTRYRMMYVIIFGAMSTAFLNLLFVGSHIGKSDNRYLNILIKTVADPLITTLTLAVEFFPFFACVDAPVPLLGHLLGFLYSCLYTAQYVRNDILDYNESKCKGADKAELAVEVGSNSLVYIFLFIAVVWFFLQLMLDLIQFLCRGISERRMEFLPKKTHPQDTQYYFKHVKALLRKNSEGKTKRFLASKVHHVFPYNKNFRFPLKFLGAVTAMFMILYQLSFRVAYYGIVLGKLWDKFGSDWVPVIEQQLEDLEFPQSVIDVVKDVTGGTARGLAVLFYAIPFINFILCVILLINMVASVHKDLEKVAREGFSFLRSHVPPPTFRLSYSLKYVGLQIGFFIWAWITYNVVLLALGVVGIGVYFAFKYIKALTFLALSWIVFPLVWTLIVIFSQVVAVKLLFVEKGSTKFVGIRNQRLFNWITYILFFYNALVGMVGAVARVLIAGTLGLLLMFRLDRIVLMRGFEFVDFGYKAYIGFLYLEYTYSNAVVNVFVRLLASDVLGDHHDYYANTEGLSIQADESLSLRIPQTELKSKKARNRWLVAYTLLRNPSLQGLTASKLYRVTGAEMKEENPTHQRRGSEEIALLSAVDYAIEN